MKNKIILLLLALILISVPGHATVSSEDMKTSASCDGVISAFVYNFRIIQDSDMSVVVNTSGVETTLTLTSDYTVANATYPAIGGTVTLLSPSTDCTTSDTLHLSRNQEYLQETQIGSGIFPARTHEDIVDELTMSDHQLKDASERSLKVNSSSSLTEADLTLTPAASSALCWDASATAMTTCATGSVTSSSFTTLSNNYSSDLATMVTAIGAAEQTVFVDVPNTLSANLVIPENIHLRYLRNSVTTATGGSTLSVNGPLEAGNYQIFDGFDIGELLFKTTDANSPVQELNVLWTGTVCESSSGTDNSTDINIMTYAASEGGVRNVLFPPGEDCSYWVSSPVFVTSNTTLNGYGAAIASDGTHSALTTAKIVGGVYVTNIGETALGPWIVNDSQIKGITFQGSLATDPLVDLNFWLVHSVVLDSRFEAPLDNSASIGLRMLNSWTSTIDNFYMAMTDHEGTCIVMGNDGTAGGGEVEIINSKCFGTGQVATGVSYGFHGVTLSNNNFEGLLDGISYSGAFTPSVIGPNNVFEGNENDIHLGAASGPTDGVIFGNRSIGSDYFLHLERGTNFFVYANTYDNALSTKYLMGASETENAGNIIWDKKGGATAYDWTTDTLGLKGGRNSVTIINSDLNDYRYKQVYLTAGAGTPTTMEMSVALTDGITAPGTVTGQTQIYVDLADGYLKAKFGDGTVKILSVDSIVSTYTQTYSTASRTVDNPTGVSMGDLVATSGGWGASSEANFDKITTAVDQLIADNLNLRKVVTALIDDLQTNGLVE